jgi:microcystin-dependent protein
MSITTITKDEINYNNVLHQLDALPHSGTVFMWSGNTAPTGALLCDGQSLNKNTYSELFYVIGYRYGGSGDNFNIPNFTNRYLFGQNSMQNNNSALTGNWEIQDFSHTHKVDISDLSRSVSDGAGVETSGEKTGKTYNSGATTSFTVSVNTPDLKIAYKPYYTLCNYIIYY